MIGSGPVLAQGGHGHVLEVGVHIGPLALRVALLAAVPVVAGFALLRGFLGEPDRRTAFAVVLTAAGAAVLMLLLAGGLDLPEQVVPLLLAALAVPMYVLRSTDPRFAAAVARVRATAPAVFAVAAVVALGAFGRAWLGLSAAVAVTLHTGAVVALVGLAWFAVARPTGRVVTGGLLTAAALLAVALIGASAQAVVLRQEEPGRGGSSPDAGASCWSPPHAAQWTHPPSPLVALRATSGQVRVAQCSVRGILTGMS